MTLLSDKGLARLAADLGIDIDIPVADERLPLNWTCTAHACDQDCLTCLGNEPETRRPGGSLTATRCSGERR